MQLLTLLDLEVNARINAFAKSFKAITGSDVPVGRSATEQAVRIHIPYEGNPQSDYLRATTDRGISEWALAIHPGASFELYVAFDEVWDQYSNSNSDWRHLMTVGPQEAPRRRPSRGSGAASQFSFGGLRLRFYLQRSGKAASELRQWLRCEWDPYRFTLPDRSTYKGPLDRELIMQSLAFDANSAAHPHFHFDSVPLAKRATKRLPAANVGGLSSPFGESADALLSEFAGGLVTSENFDVYHMHLPSSAEWPLTTWTNAEPSVATPLPHQRYPASVAELDNWFCWNLSYFLTQFQEYLADC